MGIFKTNEEAKQRKEERENMIVTTAFSLDQPFETIGLVHANHNGTGNFEKLVSLIKATAAGQGADAIIGFQAMEVRTATNFIDQTAYGTAVRYKKEMQG